LAADALAADALAAGVFVTVFSEGSAAAAAAVFFGEALRGSALRGSALRGGAFAGAALRADFFAGFGASFAGAALRVAAFREDLGGAAAFPEVLVRLARAGALAAGAGFLAALRAGAFFAAFLGVAFLPAFALEPFLFVRAAVFRVPPELLRAPDFAVGEADLRFANRAVSADPLGLPADFDPLRLALRSPVLWGLAFRAVFFLVLLDPGPAFVFLALAAMISSSAARFLGIENPNGFPAGDYALFTPQWFGASIRTATPVRNTNETAPDGGWLLSRAKIVAVPPDRHRPVRARHLDSNADVVSSPPAQASPAARNNARAT
jgi:hypothetical protein